MANKSESWPPPGWLVLEPEPSIMKLGMLSEAELTFATEEESKAALERYMAFGAEEMRRFAIDHSDERVVAMYRMIVELKSHAAKLLVGPEINRVLRDVLSAVAKLDDAPVSARAHLDRVITLLVQHTDWRPDDSDLLEIINDALISERMLKCQSDPPR